MIMEHFQFNVKLKVGDTIKVSRKIPDQILKENLCQGIIKELLDNTVTASESFKDALRVVQEGMEKLSLDDSVPLSRNKDGRKMSAENVDLKSQKRPERPSRKRIIINIPILQNPLYMRLL